MAEDGSIVFRVDADDKAAQKKLDQLRRSIEKTAKAVETSEGKRNAIAEKLQRAREEAQKTAEAIEATKNKIAESNRITNPANKGKADPFEFVSAVRNKSLLAEQLKEQQKAYQQQSEQVSDLEEKEREILATLQRQTDELTQQKKEAGAVDRMIAEQSSGVMPQVRAATEQVTKSVRSGVRSILKWGFGIKAAAELMKRLKNATIESIKAFAEHDAETKANIDGLKASLQTLKLSWGAAFAPILNAVAPLLQKLIDWLTRAANAIASFFAVLSGKSTYKRAIANNGGLAESYEGAGNAAEEAEKQIMGFDEINKLSDNSSNGSGGGGGGAGGGEQAFEEVPVDPATVEFLEKVKRHLREITILAAEVGAALLAWKLSSILPFSFSQIFGILTTIIGAVVLVKEYLNAWTTGVSWDNFIGMLEGAALVILGLTLAFGTMGGIIGQVVIGIAFLVLGIKDWITTGELSSQTCALICMGLLMIGVALAGVTGGWSLIAAAAIAAALLIYKNWDKIKQWWTEHVVAKFKECAEELKQDWENVKTSVKELKDDVVKKWEELKEKVTGAISTLKTEIPLKWDEIKRTVSEKVTGIWQTVTDTWENIKTGVLGKIETMKTSISTKWEEIKSTISGKIERIKSLFNFTWSFPKPKMPHFIVNWQKYGPISLPHVTVDWYAKGGIFDQASLIGVGEAGKEAVVPLERNTGWIDNLADSILDKVMNSNRFADFITGAQLPALASGQIVPPRAVSGGSMFSDDDINRLVSGIASAIGMLAGGEEERVPVNIDGRKVAEIVTKHQRRMNRGLDYDL